MLNIASLLLLKVVATLPVDKFSWVFPGWGVKTFCKIGLFVITADDSVIGLEWFVSIDWFI